jgi:phosphoglycolate phosphatase
MTKIPLLSDSPAALEALSRVEIVYTDLDGTLLGRGGSLLVDGDGSPSTVTADAIVRVNAAGLTVVVTTGRNRIQCTEITRLLGWRGFIAELGAVVVPERGAEPIYATGDWPADAMLPGETPWQAIERVGAPRLLAECFPGRIEPHAPYHYNREATHLLRGCIDMPEAQAALDVLELPVRIVDNGVIHPIATGLVGVDEVHSYHLAPPGVRKVDAIVEDLARRGLTREQAASIGDAPADVEMADATAVCVLVGNALGHVGVAEAADSRANVYATTGHRGDGWAEFASAWLAAHG